MVGGPLGYRHVRLGPCSFWACLNPNAKPLTHVIRVSASVSSPPANGALTSASEVLAQVKHQPAAGKRMMQLAAEELRNFNITGETFVPFT